MPSPAARYALVLALLLGASAAAASTVPAPFEPLRLEQQPGAVVVLAWGRRYVFDAGPLPAEVTSQGVRLFVQRPRFLLHTPESTGEPLSWQPPVLVEARPDAVRLRFVAEPPGLRVEAETRVEYDGMVGVDFAVHATKPAVVSRLSYALSLAPQAMRLFSHHLPYDYRAANVDKARMFRSAGTLPARLTLPFTPTLALGDRQVGIEWWSETNAHWTPLPGRPFDVLRRPNEVRLTITPLRTPLTLAEGSVWRDSFSLFVFPARPPPERWRAVRILPHVRARNFDDGIGTRFMYLAMPAAFQARHDGLPGSVDDGVQRKFRQTLKGLGGGYMPYGMLTVAPHLHPRTMASHDKWSADGKWLRLQPGFDNPVIRRTHPELGPGAPYGYAVCAARTDYFDWILTESVATVRKENPDALYFDHGGITRMCVRNPLLAGRKGAEVWEYGNVRTFYKRLYEQVKATHPRTLLMTHTHGAPKAIAAFVDFHIFGEALNGVFGGGHSATEYRKNPSLFTPDYLALPDGYLDAHLFPPVGGVAIILPQIKWAIDPANRGRARAFQRAFHALALSNDAHVVLGVSDFDTTDKIYRAVDRFGDIGTASVHPWWSNAARIRRAEPLRATAWVRDGKALLVLANLAPEPWEGRVELDLAALSVPGASGYRDLERGMGGRRTLEAGGFTVKVPPRDLRIMLVE